MSKKVGYVSLLMCPFIKLLIITANANMVWPALYIAEGMRSIWVILGGLIIEIIFIKIFIKTAWLKTILISLAMNVTSTLVGVIIIPLFGFLGEIMLIPLDGVLKLYTFHTVHWVVSCIVAAICNVLLESLCIKLMFKYKLRQNLWWILAANIITVFICFYFGGLAEI